MKLGVLSDVHGNRHALEAVVEDGRARGVDRWWALGDLVAIGPEPVATLERIAALPEVAVIAGNTDRYVLTRDRPSPHPEDVAADPSLLGLFASVEGSFAWTNGALAATGWLPWLRSLPGEVRLELPDGTRVLGVHATPGRDDGDGISPDVSDDDLRRTVVGFAAEIVIGGHTHRPTDRVVDGVRALNGGSLSNPMTDDLRASYLIVHGDRHGHHVEHRRVAYDSDAFVASLAASGHPEHEFIASFQRGERTRFASRRPGAPSVD